MVTSKKAQSKAGVPARRRGQQMGDERSGKIEALEAKKRTPALSGRRKSASKFFADKSSQAGGSGESPRDVSPSVPAAIPTGGKVGESEGERSFAQRQKASVKGKRQAATQKAKGKR
jgi:hypothetical protein